jgi:hypothetical protein
MWQSNIHCIFAFFLCSYCLVVSPNSINLRRCLATWWEFRNLVWFLPKHQSPHRMFLFWILVGYHHSQVFGVIYLSAFTLGRWLGHFSCFLGHLPFCFYTWYMTRTTSHTYYILYHNASGCSLWHMCLVLYEILRLLYSICSIHLFYIVFFCCYVK